MNTVKFKIEEEIQEIFAYGALSMLLNGKKQINYLLKPEYLYISEEILVTSCMCSYYLCKTIIG
jgi:hypothetical protein